MVGKGGGGKGRGEEEGCLGAFSDPIHLQITIALDEKVIPPPPPPKRNAPNGVNELPEVCFEFPVSLIGKSTIAFFNRPILVRTQILVHRWGPETRFWR